jgi:precorrin-8X/cobalt-precorrin-8 methylmutase
LKRRFDYLKDGAAIYRQSFATIRQEAELERFSVAEERIAVRIIHACGMAEAARDLYFSPGAAGAAELALRNGAPIFCDSRMVAEGVTRSRLPANNDVVCVLSDPSTPALAARLGTTRTAAAIDLWLPRLGGSLVAIGNAPTALYRLLELIADGAPCPAAVVGMPVGFVGAAESKLALIDSGLPAIAMRGRKGGSAMAAAAINALASDAE